MKQSKQGATTKVLFEKTEKMQDLIIYAVSSALWFVLFFTSIWLLNGVSNLEKVPNNYYPQPNNVIYGIISFLLDKIDMNLYQVFMVSGILLAIFGIHVIFRFRDILNTIRDFKRDYKISSYKLNFENMPSFGRNTTEEIVNHLQEIYPDFVFSRSPTNYFEEFRLNDDNKRVFDLFIKDAKIDGEEGSVVVEIKTGVKKLSLSDLIGLIKSVEQLQDKFNSIGRFIVVSGGGYGDDVISYAEKFNRFKIDLLKIVKDQFEVIHVS